MGRHVGDSSVLVTTDERAVAFLPPSRPAESHLPCAGVERGRGPGAALHGRFFADSAAHGRSVVRAITSPEN